MFAFVCTLFTNERSVCTLTEICHIVRRDCSRNSRSQDNQQVVYCRNNAPNSAS